MKNYFKKHLIIMMSLTLLVPMSLYASEQKPVLSLKDTIQSAFIYSNQISLNSKENELLKEQLKAVDGSSYATYQTTYLKKGKNEQQEAILKDQVTYDITNRYNALILLKKEIETLEANIALNTQELQSMALKKEIGLISSAEYNTSAIQLDIQKNTRTAKLESLANNDAYFKILTNRNPANYILDDTLSYEPFRIPGSIDGYITTKIDDYLKYDNDIVQLQSDNIITSGGPSITWVSYLGQKYQVDQSLSAIENTKKSLRQALMTSYSSLLSLEEQIGTLQNQLKLTTQQIAISKSQLDVGLITASVYNKQLLSLSDTEYNLRKLINSYNTLKMSIQKPWSSSGGM